MINASTIMQDILEWLQDDPELDGVRMSRAEVVNESPSLAANGWVGIYRRRIDYSPRNLGVPPNNYEGTLVFDVVVQSTNAKTGADSEDALETLVKKVLDRIVQVPRTYIDTFTNAAVAYTYIESNQKSLYFQAALLTMEAKFSIEVV